MSKAAEMIPIDKDCCDPACQKCSPKKRIQGACDEVLASVEDRRENGGTRADVRAKTLNLIELLFADLEA